MSYIPDSSVSSKWVGELPPGWRNDWLKWSVRLSTNRPTEDQSAELPYVSNEDIASWTGKLLKDELQPSQSDGRLFRSGDVLFNKLRPYLAKALHVEFDGVSSGELLCLRPADTVLPKYLFYVVTSKGFVDTVDSATFGSKMPRADWETVGHQPLPLPPMETQRCIARFLDDKTARIDTLIEKKRALLDRLAEKRQALITHAVTKGLDPNAPMKDSGIDWLGEIPAHWVVTPLYARYEVALGKMLDERSITGDWLLPYLRNVDIQWGQINLTDLPRMDIRPNEQARYTVCQGDLLVCEGGEVGRAAVAGQEATGLAYQKALHRLRPVKKTESTWFMFYVLRCATDLGVFVSNGNTNTIVHLTAEKLRRHRFAFPSKDEQRAIVEFLDVAVDRIDLASRKISESIDMLTEHRSALITAAVTGQLDVAVADRTPEEAEAVPA